MEATTIPHDATSHLNPHPHKKESLVKEYRTDNNSVIPTMAQKANLPIRDECASSGPLTSART